jgi:thiol-disulfide isomerase/thioredoxin
MLPHLHNGWQVDQAILSEEERVVVVRFGHDWDPTCMQMDEILYKIADKVLSCFIKSVCVVERVMFCTFLANYGYTHGFL